jgi:lipopolysaccharide export system protein LptA
VLGLAALLALPVPAVPQGLDFTRGGPVDVTADDGIEWHQQQQMVVARRNARAVRDGVTVDADRLIARYRPRASATGTTAAAPQPGADGAGGSSEIWRLEAEGNVRITTATDRAEGDRAVYDMDQAVMVLTGRNLSLTTPDNRLTARDSLEYWPRRRMAVARGGAVAEGPDQRRIRADTLVGFFLEDPPQQPGGVRPAAAPARPPPQPGQPAQPETSRIDRVEAYGNVEVRTATEVVRGDRGVYSPATNMARVLGNVRITRGQNQLQGTEAIVNLATGVARLVSVPGAPVQGLIVPENENGQPQQGQPQQGQTQPGQPGRTPPPAQGRQGRPAERRP